MSEHPRLGRGRWGGGDSGSTVVPAERLGRRAALVVGHPGHELRVHGWLEVARPTVWILTDGSGHGERGRIAGSRAVVEGAGARAGDHFGGFTDREAYRSLLARDSRPWVEIVDRLAAAFVAEGIDLVVADAAEGFNPVHDLCRVVADAAAFRAERGGARISRFGFPLEAAPGARVAGLSGPGVVLELDGPAVERKLAAARGYPEMAFEVERALAVHGTGAFRREVLWEVDPAADLLSLFAGPPEYEKHGARRVEHGHYELVLRYREHFVPVAADILRHVGFGPLGCSCAS